MRKLLFSIGVIFTFLPGNIYSQFNEDFESTFPPTGWSVINNGDANTWLKSAPGSGSANSGSNVARIDYDSDTAHNDYLVTAQFTVVANTTDRFSFYARNRSSSFAEEFNVLLSTSGNAAVNFSTTLDTLVSPPTTWQHYTYDLSAFIGQSVYIAIHAISQDEWELYIDDVVLDGNPTCFTPASLGATNITTSSADIFWTTGGASNWNIEYGPSGFALGAGTMVNATNDTVAISGLNAQTAYDFYVRDSCGVGDVSAYSGPYSFTTLCAAVTSYPWTEDFETSTNTIPACWENETGDNADWIFRNGSIGHGATVDHTLGTSSGYYAGVDDSHSSTNDTVNNLLLPAFDLTSLTSPRLVFYHFIGNDATLTSTLYIDVYDGTTWHTAVDTVSYTSEAWLLHILDLTPYKSVNTRIRFRVHETTDFNSDISVDDVVVEETPACSAPSALGATNITSTSADIYWTTGGASDWVVEYGLSGFTPGSGTSVPATNDTISLASLLSNTDYDFYVKDSCSTISVSVFSGPYTFTTLCGIFTAPYSETFNATTIPVCWTDYEGTGDGWHYSGTPGYAAASAGDHTGNSGSFAWIDFSGTDDSVSLESPEIDITGLTDPSVSFYLFSSNTNDGSYNDMFIEAYDGAGGWVMIDSLRGELGGWTQFAYNIGAYAYNTNIVKIRFRGESGGATNDFYNDLLVDDIEVGEMPCLAPTSLGATNVTNTSADIYWTPGGASNWNIEYGPSGFIPGTGTSMAVTNDTVSLASLNAGTSYDFYVQDSCGVGDVSAFMGPYSFNTQVCNSADQCTYSLIQSDSYGDGWNGTEVTIYQNNSVVMVLGPNFTSSTGSPAGDTLLSSVALCDSMDAYFVITSASSSTYPEEIGIEVRSAYGVQSAFYDNTSGAAQGDTIILFMADCAPPTCIPPGNLGAFAIGANSATLYFTPGGAANFNIEYGTAGFTPGTGAMLSTTNDTVALTGLLQNHNYQFYVQDSCGAGNVSPWVGPYGFTTLCSIYGTPFTETFDSTFIPPCWADYEATGDGWHYSGTPGYAAASAGDHTGNAGSFAWIDFSSTDDSVSLETPEIDLTGLTTPALSFYLFSSNTNDGTSYNDMFIEAYDGAGGWVLVDSLRGELGGWTQFAYNISSYTYNTSIVKFRFRGESGGATNDFYNDLLIDDVGVGELPCLAPSMLGATGTGATTADIYWTGGGASNWNVEYGTGGFTPGTGTLVNTTNDTVSITGLTPNHNYQFYVRDSCGAGNVSAWAGPFNFGATVVPCDNFDSYTTGLVDAQSALINGWAGAGGDAEISSDYANSSPYSLKIHESGTNAFSDVVAEVGVHDSAVWSVSFDFYIPASYGGYYNILHSYTGSSNVWAIEVYLDSAGNATVDEGTNGSGTIGSFSFNMGAWNHLEHVIDLDNDTAYIYVNGSTTASVAWQFSLGSTNLGDQFNAMNFYTGAPGSLVNLMYFDNFCVSPYTPGCPVAGSDAAGAVCETDMADLSTYLDPAASSGGSWIDEDGTGALTGSMLDASLAGAGSYDFTYYVVGTGSCPNDSATISITVEAAVNAGSDAGDTLCDTLAPVDLSVYLSAGVTAGGTWIDVNGTGALSGSIFDPSQVTVNSAYDFRYEVSSSNSCPDDSATVSLYVKECIVSLEEYSLGRVSIYPNPTRGEFYLEMAGQQGVGAVKIEVYSIGGRLLMSHNYEGKAKTSLDLSHFSDGIYTVKVMTDDFTEIHRIAKQ